MEQEQSAIKRAQGLVRWVVVTAWWVVVAQWFFGPPLIDRGFKWTGGKCDVLLEEGAKDAGELVTAAACKLAGGAWIGGHDISGHVFLLVLGSAFLGMEVLPVFMARKDMIGEEEDDGQTWAVWFVGGVGALSWWMILMTATYFHTWFEKVSLYRLEEAACADKATVDWSVGCIRGHRIGVFSTVDATSSRAYSRSAKCMTNKLTRLT